MEVGMGVGERIRSIRIEKKMSQLDLAGKAFSRNYLSQIERGLIKPSQRAISHCAMMLDVPAFFLINEGAELNDLIVRDLDDKYLQMKNAFMDNNYEQCVYLFVKIDDLGSFFSSKKLMSMTLWATKSYFALQEYDNSMRLIESINQKNHADCKDEMEIGLELNLCKSNIYYNQGELKKALNCRLEIEKKINEYDYDLDVSYRIDNLSWIQVLYEFLDNTSEVKRYFDRIQELTKKNKVVTRGLLRSMTRYYRDANISFQEKMSRYKILDSLARMIDDWDRVAIIYCSKIELLFDAKDYDLIKENLDELNSVIMQIESPILVDYYKAYLSLFKSKLMTVYWRYIEAKKLLNTAIEFLEKNKTRPEITLMIDCYFQSAIMYNMKKEYDSSLLYLDMAETASKKYGLLNRLPKIYNLKTRILGKVNLDHIDEINEERNVN